MYKCPIPASCKKQQIGCYCEKGMRRNDVSTRSEWHKRSIDADNDVQQLGRKVYSRGAVRSSLLLHA